MIKLRFTHRKFLEFPPPGTVLHLKVVSFEKEKGGSYDLAVEDVTPLPEADRTSYTCESCGSVVEAKPDGSLPEGWIIKEYEKGRRVRCEDIICHEALGCRVCGCTDLAACETADGPCHWVEENLCSACATPKK